MAIDATFLINSIAGSTGVAVLFAPGAFAVGGFPLCLAVLLVFLSSSNVTLRCLAQAHEALSQVISLKKQHKIRLRVAREFSSPTSNEEDEEEQSHQLSKMFDPLTGVCEVTFHDLTVATSTQAPVNSRKGLRRGSSFLFAKADTPSMGRRALTSPLASPTRSPTIRTPTAQGVGFSNKHPFPNSSPSPQAPPTSTPRGARVQPVHETFELHTLVHFFLGRMALATYDWAVIFNNWNTLFVRIAVMTTIMYQFIKRFAPDAVLNFVLSVAENDPERHIALTEAPQSTRNLIVLVLVLFHAPIMVMPSVWFGQVRKACKIVTVFGHVCLVAFLVSLYLLGGPKPDAPHDTELLSSNGSLLSRGATISVVMAAFCTANFPHAKTPGGFNVFGPSRGARFHQLLECLVTVYMVLLGVLQCVVLPTRYNYDRIISFVLIDVEQWVPDVGRAWMLCLAWGAIAIPFAVTLADVRGNAESVAEVLLRRESRLKTGSKKTKKAVKEQRLKKLSWYLLVVAALLASNTKHSFFWLSVCSTCVLHCLYLAMSFRVRSKQMAALLGKTKSAKGENVRAALQKSNSNLSAIKASSGAVGNGSGNGSTQQDGHHYWDHVVQQLVIIVWIVLLAYYLA